jgi:tetratricopeptide (TPR) repeat protein
VTNRLLAVDTFALSLHSRWRVVLFLLALALGGAAVSRVAIRTALAARLAESLVQADLRRALALDPDNPAIFNRLGVSFSFLPDLSTSSEGIHYLRQAVRLNPDETLYWLNLASSCELAGEVACADEAFGRALALSPMVPRVQWMAANYYLRTDRPAEARARFRRVLAMGPWYVVPALQTCFRSFPDPEILVREVLPEGSNPAPRLALLNLLSSQGEVDAAYQVWVLALKDAPPPAFADVRPFLSALIQSGRPARAWLVWQDLIRSGVVRRPAPDNPANLVFNGDFEQAPLNGGFDWTFRDEPYLELAAQSPGAVNGSRCLRVDFTVGHNDEHEPVSQYIPVAPQQTYTLSAYVRAEAITSDSGPRLRVLDAACPRCLEAVTDPVVGTRDWGMISLTFTTGDESRFVRLSVWRPRARTFPMDISGRFWLDKVALVAAPAAPH